MAKYRMIPALLTPDGDYTKTAYPKAYADFMALDKAYESNDFESMESILSNYELKNGAVEEHDDDSDTIIVCDRDGYYLLEKIRG